MTREKLVSYARSTRDTDGIYRLPQDFFAYAGALAVYAGELTVADAARRLAQTGAAAITLGDTIHAVLERAE